MGRFGVQEKRPSTLFYSVADYGKRFKSCVPVPRGKVASPVNRYVVWRGDGSPEQPVFKGFTLTEARCIARAISERSHRKTMRASRPVRNSAPKPRPRQRQAARSRNGSSRDGPSRSSADDDPDLEPRIPVARLAPILLRGYSGVEVAIDVIAERSGVPFRLVKKVLREQVEDVDLDTADRLLIAADQEFAWLEELDDLYLGGVAA
jgi:hypothetical protein